MKGKLDLNKKRKPTAQEKSNEKNPNQINPENQPVHD